MGNGHRVTHNKVLHFDQVFAPKGEPGDIAYRCVVYTMQRFDVGNYGGTLERRPRIEGHVDHDLGAPFRVKDTKGCSSPTRHDLP